MHKANTEIRCNLTSEVNHQLSHIRSLFHREIKQTITLLPVYTYNGALVYGTLCLRLFVH